MTSMTTGHGSEGTLPADKCVEIAKRIKLAPGEEEKMVQALIDPETLAGDSPIVRLDLV